MSIGIGRFRCSRLLWPAAIATLLLGACAPPASTPGPSTTGTGQPAGPKTLNIAIQVEPLYLASRALRTSGNSEGMTLASFNAGLAHEDERLTFRPHLAEALPQLNTDTWRVNPDGTMETVWRLKPNLVWHDGTPLSAEAWVFSFSVFSNPDNGRASQVPHREIAEILAPDDRTVVIRWKRAYPDADGMIPVELPALPRHLLEAAVARGDPEALGAQPFWTREYVGLGPYRLVSWEPGAFIQAEAFDRYVWGRPRIDRLNWVFIGDPTVVIGNFLAGAVDIGFDNIFRTQQADILQQQWGPGQGVVLRNLRQLRRIDVQQRPDYQKLPALLDARGRKAVIHAIDREALNEALVAGNSRPIDAMAATDLEFYAEAERVVSKYPFDPRRSEQYLNELGFARGSDGVYTSPTAGRFAFELWVLAGTQNEQELHVVGENLRRMGFDVAEYVVPPAQVQNNMVRSTFPGLSATSGGTPVLFKTELAGRPENRWTGGNFGGYINPEYDRLVEIYQTRLDRTERYAAIIQALKLLSDEVATIPTLYNPQVLAHVTKLSGPLAPLTAYNMHEWVLK